MPTADGTSDSSFSGTPGPENSGAGGNEANENSAPPVEPGSSSAHQDPNSSDTSNQNNQNGNNNNEKKIAIQPNKPVQSNHADESVLGSIFPFPTPQPGPDADKIELDPVLPFPSPKLEPSRNEPHNIPEIVSTAAPSLPSDIPFVLTSGETRTIPSTPIVSGNYSFRLTSHSLQPPKATPDKEETTTVTKTSTTTIYSTIETGSSKSVPNGTLVASQSTFVQTSSLLALNTSVISSVSSSFAALVSTTTETIAQSMTEESRTETTAPQYTPEIPAVLSSKAGLAWPWNNPDDHFHAFENAANNGKISWLYNWELWDPRKGKIPRTEYIANCRTASTVDQLMGYFSSGYCKRLMGFNEPDMPSQANLDPEVAARLWVQYFHPLKANFGTILGAPSVSNGYNGKNWYERFMRACQNHGGCKIDFIPIHWYGNNFNDFKSHIEYFYRYNVPLWVTEYAFTSWSEDQLPSEGQVENFMRQSKGWMDSNPRIERYSYFGPFDMDTVDRKIGRANSLIIDGKLTNVGRIYVGERS